MGRRKGHLALPSPRAPLSFLSTFIHNMLAFGLTKKLCSDFLKKQATIGNLDEGGAGGDAMHTTTPPLPGMLWHGPSIAFPLPLQSNTSCSATTLSRWPPSSGTARWQPEQVGRATCPQNKAGLLETTQTHTHVWSCHTPA